MRSSTTPYLQFLSQQQEIDSNSVHLEDFKTGRIDLSEDEDLSNYPGVPSTSIVSSSELALAHAFFNQRPVAPNARANGGQSIFTDPNVRKAFIETFDRCTAIKQLDLGDCTNPDSYTDEMDAPIDYNYDPNIVGPGYHPQDAAQLMDKAGFHVVNGIRMNKDGKTPLSLSIVTLPTVFPLAQRMQRDFQTNLQIEVSATQEDVQKFLNSFTAGGTLATGAFDISMIRSSYRFESELLGDDVTSSIPSTQNPIGFNYAGVSDKLIDQQYAKLSIVFEDQQRTTIYQSILDEIASHYDEFPLYVVLKYSLIRHTIGNYKQSPDGTNNWNIADWYSCAVNHNQQNTCSGA